MQPDNVRRIYDEGTARTYRQSWLGGAWDTERRLLVEAITRQVDRPDLRWLDAGCGTGYFLSEFPGLRRCGIDLSPSMLAHAQEANPDADFFEVWDLRDPNPQWHDTFSLVTCTGQPWSYLDTVAEMETVVENLASWTAPEGTCFFHVLDGLDLSGIQLPYRVSSEPGFTGEIQLEAVVWSLEDRNHEDDPSIGVKYHKHMIWPALDHWITLFERHFRNVCVETLPREPDWQVTGRRILLASDKRAAGDDRPAVVTRRTIPSSAAVDAAPGDAHASEPSAPCKPPVPSGPSGHPRRLRDLTLAQLGRKVRPWDRRFWGHVATRLRQNI
ncbi:MAG: class I SAM-dependent methyltransferase [Acidimicrobiia bacterium]|nr:class I SAM-dependent methyltransferase [Acidimicrobiia bacterium]